MSETTRTFIAVAVPETLERKLTRLQAQLSGEATDLRWESAMPFHITLAFLGEVGHGDLNAVCKAVVEAVEPLPRFELTLEGLGAFPDSVRPRVLWTGPGKLGLESLQTLQSQVTEALDCLGYRPESRPFLPHVTLGRGKPGKNLVRDLTKLINHYKTWHAGPFPVTEVVTFGSSLTREGPIYAPLGRAPLRGRKPGASP